MRQGRAVRPGEACLRGMNRQKRATDDGIWSPALNVPRDCSSVDIVFDGVVFPRGCDTISEEVGNVVEEGSFKRLFFVSRTRRGTDDVMRSVRPSVRPCYFQMTKIVEFEDRMSSNDIINNATMSDDEVVASYGPPRSLL